MPAPPSSPLLLSVFATFAVGGPQVRFATLANRLGRAWRHAIIAMDGNLACREKLSAELEVTFPSVHLGKRPDQLLRQMRAAIRAVRPDVMLTHNWGSIEWTLANRLPFALTRHVHAEDGFGPDEQTRQRPRRVWARRLALRRVSVVLPSQTLLTIAKDVWRLPAPHLHYVPNGINLSRFRAQPSGERPAEWNLAPGGVTIGTVAALRPEKNLARLIRAFALLPAGAARLVIVGDGPERGSLQQLAARLPAGQVCFAGHMPDPSGAYGCFDIFALTSDTEQMPLTLLEAMASGLPVVATEVGDVGAIVAACNRDFLTAKDDIMFAAALIRLVTDPTLRRRLGEANCERAKSDFAEDTMIRTWQALLAGDGGSTESSAAGRV